MYTPLLLSPLPTPTISTTMSTLLTPSPWPLLSSLRRIHRRLSCITTTTTSLLSSPPPQLPAGLSSSPHPSQPLPPLSSSAPDTTITDRVFMDFSLCPTFLRPDRTLGDTISSICTEPVPLGRLVLGLYGHVVPLTVANFKTMCSSSSYKNTLVHKIFPGQFFLAGRQGRRDKGEVQPPSNLARNIETIDSKAFKLTHSRAGIVSLCLSENDDDEDVKQDPDYRNVEFLITTGPGPCPQLDNKNIVFGVVLEGMDVVTAIASIPTYKPSERIRQFNDFAEFIGDDRAQIGCATWDKPVKTVYISDCGELKVTKPSFTPSLP